MQACTLEWGAECDGRSSAMQFSKEVCSFALGETEFYRPQKRFFFLKVASPLVPASKDIFYDVRHVFPTIIIQQCLLHPTVNVNIYYYDYTYLYT